MVNAPLITVITPTLNSSACLPRLLYTLESQSISNFAVIIADGGSIDNTVKLAKASLLLNLTVLEGPDSGIYDGINKSLRICTTQYYLVVGSDDYLFPEAIENFFHAAVSSQSGLITAPIISSNRLIKPGRVWNPAKGPFSLITSHSVGCLIKLNLHTDISFYCEELPIAADYLFFQKCIDAGIQPLVINYITGFYSSGGLSSVSPFTTILDQYKALYLSKKYRKFLWSWVPVARISFYYLKKFLSQIIFNVTC